MSNLSNSDFYISRGHNQFEYKLSFQKVNQFHTNLKDVTSDMAWQACLHTTDIKFTPRAKL